MSDAVLYELDGQVAVITINRPEARNAINIEVRDGLFEAFGRFNADPQAAVALLTGAGDKAFCAGMDLKEMAAAGGQLPPWREFLPVLRVAIHVDKPTIAAVNGAARAGGWLLAQMCDLAIATQEATFAITEAQVGRGMPWAVPLARMLGQRHFMEIVLTGDPISAQRAYEIGFVNDVVSRAELMSRALQLARRIAANAPLSVRAARDLVYVSGDLPTDAALDAADSLFEPVYASQDAIEGARAFSQKRKPAWQGR